jgi:hypothetical protein
VGGDTRVSTLKFVKGKVVVDTVDPKTLPVNAKEKMEEVLLQVGSDMRKLVDNQEIAQ